MTNDDYDDTESDDDEFENENDDNILLLIRFERRTNTGPFIPVYGLCFSILSHAAQATK